LALGLGFLYPWLVAAETRLAIWKIAAQKQLAETRMEMRQLNRQLEMLDHQWERREEKTSLKKRLSLWVVRKLGDRAAAASTPH
jgi:hypothetical protein